jgi:hypothetical protein
MTWTMNGSRGKSTMALIRNVSAVAATMVVSAMATSGTSQLLISGRVDAVDAASGALTIQGKSIHTTDARRVLPGQFVNVYGVLNKDGSISNVAVETASTYVLGVASQVPTRAAALTGTGDEAEALTGTGDEAEALTGTGDEAEALTGTGDEAEALTGTGDEAEALTGTGETAE